MAGRYYNFVAGASHYDEYAAFPGVHVIVNHIYTDAKETFHKETKYQHMMKIEYCTAGRYECEFEKFGYVYLGCGDMAVSTFERNKLSGGFPTGYYEGVTIMIDIDRAIQSLSAYPFAHTFDLYTLKANFASCGGYFMQQAENRMKQAFLCLADRQDSPQAGYLQLKVLELLLLLQSIDLASTVDASIYFPRRQVNATKFARDYLIEHMEERPTVSQAAQEAGINITLLRYCFKAIYGKTIGCYMREYRLQEAASLLKDTNDTVYYIANRVGYTNQSKFAAAFKQFMGVSQLEYRNNNC